MLTGFLWSLLFLPLTHCPEAQTRRHAHTDTIGPHKHTVEPVVPGLSLGFLTLYFILTHINERPWPCPSHTPGHTHTHSVTPVTRGLTHSGLRSLTHTHIHTHTACHWHIEPLCVFSSARSHRPVPWPHVRPGRAASCAVSPSHGLTPFRPPHLAGPRRSRTEALPSRPAPILVSVQVSPDRGRLGGSPAPPTASPAAASQPHTAGTGVAAEDEPLPG